MPLPPLPNHLPALAAGASYRLAVLLPWPSEDDCRIRKPLTGSAGNWLRNALSAVGIKLDAEVAICHLSQSYLGTWEQGGGWEGEAVQGGIAALVADLAAWRPNLVLGLDDPRLGAGVLHLLRHGNVAPHRTPSGYQWPSKLGKWRGSLFMSQSLSGCVPTLEPCAQREELRTSGAACSFNGSSVGASASEILDDAAPVCCASQQTSQPSFGTSEATGACGQSAVYPALAVDSNPPDCGDTTKEMRTLTSAHAPGQAAFSFKCLCTFSPTYLLSVWSKAFETRQDIRRARDESRTPQLNLPPVNVSYGPVE